MSLATRGLASVSRLVQHFGEGATVSVRRRHTLSSPATGKAPSLLVNGTTSVGASSINLDATSVEGTLTKGVQFTIAGDATTYEVQSDVTASSNALASVSISPVLAQEATDNSAVTITRGYKDYTFFRARAEFAEEDVKDFIDASHRKVYVSALAAPVTPQVDDVLIDGSAEDRIFRIRTYDPGGQTIGWVLVVGENRA